VPQLLASDPSYLLLPRVWWYVVQCAQHLLPSMDPPASGALPEQASKPPAVSAAASSDAVSAMDVSVDASAVGVAAGGLFASRGPPLSSFAQHIYKHGASQGRRGRRGPRKLDKVVTRGWLGRAAVHTPWCVLRAWRKCRRRNSLGGSSQSEKVAAAPTYSRLTWRYIALWLMRTLCCSQPVIA
jgi:hypothetical protein